jgi:uncharacterized membrane protein YbhN (UPF0104 family)
MVGLTFGIGMTCAAAMTLILEPAEVSMLLNTPAFPARGVGLSILILLALYLGAGASAQRPLRIGGWQLKIPGTDG